MHLTAHDALEISAIDEVLSEPPGGAQANPVEAAQAVLRFLTQELEHLSPMDPELLMRERQQRFRDFLRFDRSDGHRAAILDFRIPPQDERELPTANRGI
jgi:acetyl-CoA carboxylase alpha subunit